jgi:hypothetical protein
MRFQFTEATTIPVLAWCMKVDKGSPIVHVVHGSWVETSHHWFVEGGWPERFSDGRFHESSGLMGSGVALLGDRIVVCTPCNTVEAVYTIVREQCLLVSNSIPFLLEAAGERLDPCYLDYESDVL